MKYLILYLQFFTRIPIPLKVPFDEQNFHKGVITLPFIGFVVGCFMCLSYLVFNITDNRLFALFLSVFMNIIITGGFHIDGVADTCDGIYSARSKERMLEIMKDSRIGTHGVCAIIFIILSKVLLLNGFSDIYYAILIETVVGKSVMPILMYKSVYPRENGMGSPLIGKVRLPYVCITLIIALVFAWFLYGMYGVLAAISVYALLFLFKKYIEHKIGGITGDILGCGVEIGEVLTLFILTIILKMF